MQEDSGGEHRAGRLARGLVVLTPAAVACAVFGNTLRNGLLYDDPAALALASAPMRELLVHRYGLTYLSIRLDRLVWDGWAPGLHLTNVVLHGVAAALAAACALVLTRRSLVALIAGLLFAVHPVHVEAVASIENRKELLAWVLVAISLLLHRMRRPGSRALALATLALALSAKEVAAVGAAAMLPLSDALPLAGEKSSASRLQTAARGALAMMGLGIVATAWYGGDLLGRFAPGSVAQATGGACRSYGEVLLASASAVPEVGRLLFFPSRLSADYPAPLASGIADWSVVTGLLFAAGWVATALLIGRKAPAAAFAIAWTVVMYLPVSNIVPLTPYFVAERYLYVPSFGVCLLVALCLATVYRLTSATHRSWMRVCVLAVVVLGVVAGAYRSAARNRDWRDALSLWTSTIAVAPDSARAHNELGRALSAAGRSEEAIPHLRRALELGLDTADTRGNLGMALLGVGRQDEAFEEFERAFERSPRNPLARYNLAWALLRAGRREEAIGHLRELATEGAWKDLPPGVSAALAARGTSAEDFRRRVRQWIERQGS